MIHLREIGQQDIARINQWRRERDLVRFLGSPYRYVNLETDASWFEAYMKNKRTELRCAVCADDNAEAIGVVYLLNMDHTSRSAEFAIMIEKESQGLGLGEAATKEILRHAFYDLNFHRIYLHVVATNDRALRLYQRVGFRQEGLLRESLYKEGKYVDVIVMGMLKNEWTV